MVTYQMVTYQMVTCQMVSCKVLFFEISITYQPNSLCAFVSPWSHFLTTKPLRHRVEYNIVGKEYFKN